MLFRNEASDVSELRAIHRIVAELRNSAQGSHLFLVEWDNTRLYESEWKDAETIKQSKLSQWQQEVTKWNKTQTAKRKSQWTQYRQSRIQNAIKREQRTECSTGLIPYVGRESYPGLRLSHILEKTAPDDRSTIEARSREMLNNRLLVRSRKNTTFVKASIKKDAQSDILIHCAVTLNNISYRIDEFQCTCGCVADATGKRYICSHLCAVLLDRLPR